MSAPAAAAGSSPAATGASRARRAAREVAVLTAITVGVCVVGGVLLGWGAPAWWAPLLLAAGVAGTELAVVHVAFRRQMWTFSLTEGVIGAAYVFATGSWTVVAVAVGVLVAQRVRRQPGLKLVFNVTLFAASTLAGSATAQALGGNIAAATAGLAVFWLVNTALVALPMSIMTDQPLGSVLWDSFSMATLQEAGTSSIGLLAAWLALHAPMGLLGLVIPLVLLWISYEEQSARSAEARLFAELARSQQSVGTHSVDVSAEVVLTAAARLFGGADVEMVLLGADGPIRYSGDETGVSGRRADPAAFDRPWVMAALGSGVRTGIEDGRPFCSAVLGDRDQPLAVCVARRAVGAAPFGRREVSLARVLVGQGESWLAAAWLTVQRDAAVGHARAVGEAARALGDLGAHTVPALGLLQESAGRLVRLATALDAPRDLDDIVGELHVVERAVASLLGAVALSADAELATAGREESTELDVPADEEPPSAASAWTTSGVLPAPLTATRRPTPPAYPAAVPASTPIPPTR